MPKVTFRAGDGSTTVDATVGTSLMQLAVQNGVSGIVAECGGNAMCATCHVHVEDGPLDRLPDLGASEDEMLDCTASPREAGSRLSCQIPITDDLDGLVVRVADEQYPAEEGAP